MKLGILLGSGLAVSFVAPLVLASALFSATAAAQQSPPILEEVTVSARKREESLLDVPLSITVLTAESIESKGIRELNQVVDFTPGFFYGGPVRGVRTPANNRRLADPRHAIQHGCANQAGAPRCLSTVPLCSAAEIGRLTSIERH
ncbi:MAG: hypothetical protein HC794_06250 [Nitrospiraceae bacterium]|nr:hypothetical protein [Nitrospiraceae bacterium]